MKVNSKFVFGMVLLFVIAMPLSVLHAEEIEEVIDEEIEIELTSIEPELVSDVTYDDIETTVLDDTDLEDLVDETVINDEEELEGIETEEVTEMPTGFGLFWRGMKEKVSLVFTFNPIKKAEKELRYASERIKIAEYISENSEDPKLQERALEITERAEEFIERVEDKKEKLLENKDEKSQRILDNVVKYKINRERVLNKIEYKLPTGKIDSFEKMKTKMQERDENFLEGVLNNENVSEEVKQKITEKRAVIFEQRVERESMKEVNRDLVEKVKQGDEEARKELQAEINKRNEEKKQYQEKIREENKERLDTIKADLEVKAEEGDETAIKKLNMIKKRENIIEKKQEIKQEIKEKVETRRAKTIEKKEINKE